MAFLSKTQIQAILEDFPCFAHYSIMHCMNKGYLKPEKNVIGIWTCAKCPYENSCKKSSLSYARNVDVYHTGQIDKPRDRIRELERQGGRPL